MTDFYADYIKKTTFDPATHSVRSKFVDRLNFSHFNFSTEYIKGWQR